MRRVGMATALALGIACHAFGQDLQDIRREDSGGKRFFIVDKAGSPVFGSTEAAVREPGRSVELGAFFFALEETEARVRLCTVSRSGNVEDVGWMNRADLLEQRTRAWSVGEGIQQGLDVVRSSLEERFRAADALPLRVIGQPERGTVLQGRPGTDAVEDDRDLAVGRARGYYVYDREVVNGRTWVLLGEGPRVLVGDLFEHTEETAPREIIRGWAPVDEMTIWASRFAIELNTDPVRVAQRVRNEDPATVYATPRRQARPLWVEELEALWGSNGAGRPELSNMVSTDPVGLVCPDFPRLMVMQGLEDYLQVASFAASVPGVQGLTELAIGNAARRAGLSPEDIAGLGSVVYYEGYVRESAVVFPESSGEQDAGPAHWRLRVLVSENEAHLLRETLEDVAAGLSAALSEDTRVWLEDIFGDVGRRELIAGVILRVLDQVIGFDRFRDDEQGRDAFAAAVRALMEAVRVGNDLADADLAGLAELGESLPVRSDGLLGLSVRELFELEEDWFNLQLRRLRNLEEGWRTIVNTRSVPENPADVPSAPRHTKYWFMETGAERIAYVPFGYIP